MFTVVQSLIAYVEKKTEQSQEIDLEQDDKSKLLSANKLSAYIMSSILCIIEDLMADNSSNADNIGKVCIVFFFQIVTISLDNFLRCVFSRCAA